MTMDGHSSATEPLGPAVEVFSDSTWLGCLTAHAFFFCVHSIAESLFAAIRRELVTHLPTTNLLVQMKTSLSAGPSARLRFACLSFCIHGCPSARLPRVRR